MGESQHQAWERSLGPVSTVLEEAVAALAIGGIAIISFANVVVRYLTDVSFAFTEEFSVFFLVLITLFGSAVAFARNGHLRIEYFLGLVPHSIRWAAATLTLLATLAVYGLVAYHGAWLAFNEWRWATTSPGLGLPNWIYTVWLPIGAMVIVLRVMGRFWRNLRRGRPD